MKDYKFIVVDFNCTSTLTHHWSSIRAYLNFLKPIGSEIEVWIPEYASPEIAESFFQANTIHTRLQSPQYGPKNFYAHPIVWALSFFAERVFPKIPFNTLKNHIKSIFLNYYLRDIQRIIEEESRNFNVFLVVPTLDYLALELTKRLAKRDIPISISVRRFGSESKSSFASGNELGQLLACARESRITRVNVGITTLTLLKELKSQSENSEHVFWCPLPPDEVEKEEIREFPKQIKVGFPGAAKKRKGTERIPEVTQLLEKSGLEIVIYFQKAPYEWDGYQDTLDRIHSQVKTYVELPAVLTIEEFSKVFDLMNFVVLPYDSKSYSSADSGILYQSADRHIPIIYTQGCGFGEEARNYGIGYELEGLNNENVGSILRKSISKNFISYNMARSAATLKFIGIDQSIYP